MKLKSPLEIYKYLPQTNCKECGYDTCMSFAAHIIDRSTDPLKCSPLLEDAKKDRKSKKKLEELIRLTSPEIREISIGKNGLKIGGEDVLFRHELTYFNPTAFFYDVWDTMDDKDLDERCSKVVEFKKFYVGKFLTLDGIAVRCVSGDPVKFSKIVKKVAGFGKPLILVSFDPKCIEAALKIISEERPLIYAANKENWEDMFRLAKEYNVPVVIREKNLDMLKSLAVSFKNGGVEDIILDPVTEPVGDGLKDTFERIAQLRRTAMSEDTDIAYPLMVTPISAWSIDADDISKSYWEAILTGIFTINFGDIMILRSLESYTVIPTITLRTNIYTDPRTPVQVEPGLKEINNPNENSPVFITTNFALTYYTVESDLSSGNIDSWLLVLDTGGLGVEVSVAGGQFTSGKVKELIDETGVMNKVKHNNLVIPGLAARLQGAIEDDTGLNVYVGPSDSGRIKGWLEKKWPPK